MQNEQKKLYCRKNVPEKDRLTVKVIHNEKAHEIERNDLYTKLYTLSTGFLHKKGGKVMVTIGTFVLFKTNKNAKNVFLH